MVLRSGLMVQRIDVSTRAKATRALLELLGDAAVPTVLVTHDFDEAAAIADEVAVIEDGRIVQRGSAEELSARPVSAFVADLTGAVVLGGVAVRRPDGLTEFNESACRLGGLGQFKAKYLMMLAMANAGRLGKYGA